MTETNKKEPSPEKTNVTTEQQQQQQQWSHFYNEAHDTFVEFASFDPKSNTNNNNGSTMMGAPSTSVSGAAVADGGRTLSSRQISGMLEGDKAADDRWAEDWNDEDQEDVFDKIAEKCGLVGLSKVQQN